MIGVVSRTRAVLTAAVLLSALALGGCTDDDPEPKFGPTESSSPASPTSPSTTTASGQIAPSMPAAAMDADAAAAEAFVSFYWKTVNYAQATGDLEPLSRLGAPTCKACKSGVEYLKDVYENGGKIDGGVGTVKIVRSALVKDG